MNFGVKVRHGASKSFVAVFLTRSCSAGLRLRGSTFSEDRRQQVAVASWFVVFQNRSPEEVGL